MSLRFAPFVSLAIYLTVIASSAEAQILTPGGGTTAPPVTGTITAEPGTILSSPSTDPQKIKCWVSRNTDRAMAVYVYSDPRFQVPMANIRLYNLGDHGFVSKQITFTDKTAAGVTTNVDQAVLNVRLEKVDDALGRLRYYEMAHYPNGFNANGTGKEPRILVGWAKFAPGKSGRSSSDAVFRLHRKIQQALGAGLPLAAPSGTTAATNDPCDGPPADDLGEEEETTSSAPLTPGPSLGLVP